MMATDYYGKPSYGYDTFVTMSSTRSVAGVCCRTYSSFWIQQIDAGRAAPHAHLEWLSDTQLADSLDHRTGEVSVNVIILAVYNALGTKGGTIVFGVLSGLGFILAVVKWMNFKKMETES